MLLQELVVHHGLGNPVHQILLKIMSILLLFWMFFLSPRNKSEMETGKVVEIRKHGSNMEVHSHGSSSVSPLFQSWIFVTEIRSEQGY